MLVLSNYYHIDTHQFMCIIFSAEFLHRVPRLRLKTKLKNKTAEIHVRWQSVASFSIAPSIFYLLYYNQFRHDPIQIKTKLTSHKLQNLELNTVYYVNIMACTKDGCGKRLEYDKFITTPGMWYLDDSLCLILIRGSFHYI